MIFGWPEVRALRPQTRGDLVVGYEWGNRCVVAPNGSPLAWANTLAGAPPRQAVTDKTGHRRQINRHGPSETRFPTRKPVARAEGAGRILAHGAPVQQ